MRGLEAYKFWLDIFELTALFLFWPVIASTFKRVSRKAQERQDAALEKQEGNLKRRLKIACLLVFPFYVLFVAPFIEYRETDEAKKRAQDALDAKPTPIRDDAMRLAFFLEEQGHIWDTNGLAPGLNIEHFAQTDCPHWILDVHNELQKRLKHSNKFDEIARTLERMGGQGLFSGDDYKHPSALLFEIRDEVRRLAEPLKE